MLSNLPPGVTDSMIPGNRPEDQEIETDMIFTCGEIEQLQRFNETQLKLPLAERHELWATVSNIVEQFDVDSAEEEGDSDNQIDKWCDNDRVSYGLFHSKND